MSADWNGNVTSAPDRIKTEAMNILGWIVLKHGPFNIPTQEEIVKALNQMHDQGLAIHKSRVDEKGFAMFVAPPEAHDFKPTH